MSEERKEYKGTMRTHNVNENLLDHLVPMDSLHLDPANARDGHDVEGIAASLSEFGQLTPLVANESGLIEKGNGTYKAAQSLGQTHIAAIFVAHDPVTGVRYAIVDNRLGDKSHFVLGRVKKLLDSIPEPETMPGVDEGWLEEIRALTGEEANYDELWDGMPEFEQDDLGPHRTLKVHFASEGDLAEFAVLIGQKITDKAKFIWHPNLERQDFLTKAYQDEP